MWFRVKISLASACLMALMTLPVSVSAANRHGYFPYGWGWGWNGCWGPYWTGPYEFYPFWEGPYETYEPVNGKIKLEHVDEQDNVFLDGSFIGTAGDVKTIKLRAGLHSLEIKHWGKDALWDKDVLKERVFIVASKTIKLNVGDKVP
jgi:hypothetical protein